MDNNLLQPGDIVHLSWPTSGNKEENERIAHQVIAMYQALGVTVSMVSFVTSPALPGPYVISVIRKPLPEEI